MDERTRRAGTTLIELMIAAVVLAIVLLGIYSLWTYFFAEVGKGEEKVALQRDADLAAYWIELAIREGSWAYLDTGGDDSLVVENLLSGAPWQTRTIYADDGKLMMDTDGDQEEIVDNLDSLHFYPYMTHVEYELAVGQGDDVVAMSSSKALRNVQYRGAWHFSEESGPFTYDASAANNNAGVYGNPWAGGGDAWLGSQSASDYVRVPDNDSLDSGLRVAFGARVNGTGTIINRNASGGPSGFFAVSVQGATFRYQFSGGDYSATASPLSSPGWHEAHVQHDGVSGRIHFYCDGVRAGQANAAGTAVTSGDLYIGSEQGTVGFWAGSLDDVRFADFGS